jgi:hypothetical protein
VNNTNLNKMNEILTELHKQHQSGQQKYTYFLLTAAGACIGFATDKAQGVPLYLGLVFLTEAVLFWGLSFYFGCKCATSVQILLQSNHNLIALENGVHPQQPQHPEMLEAALKGVKSASDEIMQKSLNYNNWQFWFFVAGGIAFVLWRITEIVRLAPKG